MPPISLLIWKRATAHLIAEVLFAGLLQLIVLLWRVHTADDARIFVKLGLVKVFLFIVALKRIICQMREEKQGQLVLPFIHELLEVLEVLVPPILIVLNLLLPPLVPLVGPDKFHNVFFVVLDPEVWLSLLLDRLELPAGLLHLGIRQICLRRDILPRCAFRLRFVANRRIGLLKLFEHVIRGESLNHRHELFDFGGHSLSI